MSNLISREVLEALRRRKRGAASAPEKTRIAQVRSEGDEISLLAELILEMQQQTPGTAQPEAS